MNIPNLKTLSHHLTPWQAIFYLILTIYALIILATLTDYGLTVDEPPLLNYGRDIITWYQSGFEYQDIFETTNTWLYGGIVHVAGHHRLHRYAPLLALGIAQPTDWTIQSHWLLLSIH